MCVTSFGLCSGSILEVYEVIDLPFAPPLSLFLLTSNLLYCRNFTKGRYQRDIVSYFSASLHIHRSKTGDAIQVPISLDIRTLLIQSICSSNEGVVNVIS